MSNHEHTEHCNHNHAADKPCGEIIAGINPEPLLWIAIIGIPLFILFLISGKLNGAPLP